MQCSWAKQAASRCLEKLLRRGFFLRSCVPENVGRVNARPLKSCPQHRPCRRLACEKGVKPPLLVESLSERPPARNALQIQRCLRPSQVLAQKPSVQRCLRRSKVLPRKPSVLQRLLQPRRPPTHRPRRRRRLHPRERSPPQFQPVHPRRHRHVQGRPSPNTCRRGGVWCRSQGITRLRRPEKPR